MNTLYNLSAKAILCTLFFVAISAQNVDAQTDTPLDEIIAVVGKDRIILKSEVEIQAAQMLQQDPSLGDDVACDILEQMLLQKLLVEQADRDSVFVSEEQVNATLDNRVRYFIMQYGSKEKLEEIAGKTVYQLKEENREATEEMLLSEQMQTQILENVKVTPVEVQQFYKNIPTDSLPFFPATVEFGQIVMDPDVTPEFDSLARKDLESYRERVVKGGENFATLAGLYSDDPGSRDDGGMIRGVNRKGGGFVTEFVVATFKLQNGEVSPVIKTQFGYHIIQMVRRKGDEADVRHILVKPERTSEDFKKAMAKLDSVRAELISGKITFEEAVGKYSTDELSSRTGGMIVNQQGNSSLLVDELDPALALMIDTLSPGSYSQPMLFTTQRGERSCRIVYMKNITKPHKANLKEDYSKIQFAALQKKKAERMQEWIADKAPSYYIKVNEDYNECPSLQKFLNSSAKN